MSEIAAIRAVPSPINGMIPPVEHRFKAGNPGKPKNCAASVNEWVNILSNGKLTREMLLKIARQANTQTKRAAAVKVLRLGEMPDLADFEEMAEGKVKLKDLRAKGIDTSVLKKIKPKTRTIPDPDGGEPAVERECELELHDRTGAAWRDLVGSASEKGLNLTVNTNTSLQVVAQTIMPLPPELLALSAKNANR